MTTDYILTDLEPNLHYLAYSESPGRPTLVFLHGVTSHAHYWDHLAPDFTGDFAVYALDWRGHGDSAYGDSYNKVEDYVSDLRRLLARLNPSRLVLVGHSLGGYVALSYAATNPDPALSAIVACDVKLAITPQEREAMARASLKPQPRFGNLEELENRFVGTLRDSTADRGLLAEIARKGARQNEDGSYSYKYDRKVLDFPEPQPLKVAAEVNVPVLVINGGSSEVVPTTEAQQLADAAPKGRHIEIAEAGHHVFLDKPQEFSRTVREFLAEVV
jgi:pimeloyl-ACP methyl ester carboxylesterase